MTGYLLGNGTKGCWGIPPSPSPHFFQFRVCAQYFAALAPHGLLFEQP